MTNLTSRASFASLNKKQQKKTHRFFDKSPMMRPNATETDLKQYVARLKHQSAPPIVLLTFTTTTLLRTNPAILAYYTRAQQNALKDSLQLAFYGLCAQYEFDEVEHRRQYLSTYFENIERCAFLIRSITLIQEGKALEVEKKTAQEEGAGFQQWFNKKMRLIRELITHDFGVGKTVYLRQWMSDFNVWRLYWVWAGGALRTAFDLFSLSFYHITSTVDAANLQQNTLGHISWALYYLRGLTNFAMVLKHSIKGAWMSEEEKKLIDEQGGSWNRFKEQLAAKKFTLINDLIWGTTNLLCFFWLVSGTAVLGPIGDWLTVLLLVGDASLSQWARTEATEEHRADLARYDDEITGLKKNLNRWKNFIDKSASEADEKRRAIAEDKMANGKANLEQLQQAREQCEQEWEYKTKKLNCEVRYGVGLLIAYTFMIFPWKELGLATSISSWFVFSSAGLCFVLSLIYSGYKAYIEVTKARESRMMALQQCKNILEIKGKISEANRIRYADLAAEADYQAQLANYQLYAFARATIVQTLIPFAIFLAFTFTPTFGIGALMMAPLILLAIVTHYIIEEYKPKQAALTAFDQKDDDTLSDGKKQTEISRLAQKIEQTRTIGLLGLFASKEKVDGGGPSSYQENRL